MRWLSTLFFVLALSVMGCDTTVDGGSGGSAGDGGSGGDAGSGGSGGTAGDGGNGGVGGSVTEAIEEMLVGRWWLDWDQAVGDPAPEGNGIPSFTAEGWANYDVKFPSVTPSIPDWCRRYADWSLFDVVSETEFGYALTYT
ncbi:MAG: hypothetical protein HKN10_16135, partial [Myxococcales bacterium]|nr:hypothetical protein [Myxococcales bacterium]